MTIEVDPMSYFPHLPFESGPDLPAGKLYPVETFMNSERVQYVCTLCCKSYKLQKTMKKHVLNKHGLEDISTHHPCEFCTQVRSLIKLMNNY